MSLRSTSMQEEGLGDGNERWSGAATPSSMEAKPKKSPWAWVAEKMNLLAGLRR